MTITKDKGYIKLYRNIMAWKWYTEPNTMRLFIHCLLKANTIDKRWRNITIKKGAFVSSVANISKELNLSDKQVRIALNKLQQTKEITCKTSNKYTYINVNNWCKYQGAENIKSNNAHKIGNIDDIALCKRVIENYFKNYAELMPAVEKWLNYKRNKGQKYTQEGHIKNFIRKLLNLSNANVNMAQEIVNNAILNNWNGIYEIKNKNLKHYFMPDADKQDYFEKLAREI